MGVMPGSETKYIVKTVAPTRDSITSLGGFHTIPDYNFETIPKNYTALILIGGMQWNSPEAEQGVPILQKAMQQNKIIGAICNAVSFMAAHGFLNDIKHTGNTVQQLQLWRKENYTNEAGYMERQAVSDKNIVTANGTGYLEFTRELLLLLHVDTEERITTYYEFNKNGLVK